MLSSLLNRLRRKISLQEIRECVDGAKELRGESALNFLPGRARVRRRKPTLLFWGHDLFGKKPSGLKPQGGPVALPEEKF